MILFSGVPIQFQEREKIPIVGLKISLGSNYSGLTDQPTSVIISNSDYEHDAQANKIRERAVHCDGKSFETTSSSDRLNFHRKVRTYARYHSSK